MIRGGKTIRGPRRARRRGFTLIELMIAILLTMILLGAVTIIFINTTETVAVSQARTHVYTQARYAMDLLSSDLLGLLPFDGQQWFCLDDGQIVMGSGGADTPTYNKGKTDHVKSGADKMTFRATTMVGDTVQTVEVIYEMVPGSKALTPEGTLRDGDPRRGKTMPTATFPDGRPLYTLVRRTRAFNAASGRYDQIPLDSNKRPVPDMELCTFVTSFNLEYYASNHTFSQLEPSPFRSDVTPGADGDPLGNGMGPNDGQGSPDARPLRIPAVRITLTIVEDIRARQERVIQRVIYLPMG